MGPKKKKGGKKGKGKKSKEEELPPEEPSGASEYCTLGHGLVVISRVLTRAVSEYDTMDVPMLKEVIQMLRQQLDKAQVDRNYVQHERVRL